MPSISFCYGRHAKVYPVRARLAAVVLTGLIFLVGSQSHADTRLAVIAAQTEETEKLAPLVELRLGKKQGIVLLEREALKQILNEQELQALMTAEGTAKRVALGKLLKADVLVILQGEKRPRPHARVVICETQRGLRFCNQPVEFSKNIETDTDAVVKLVDRAVEKQQRAVTDIVAVPPFVNNTLAYEGEHLKGAYACLIEEMLLDRPGVLVVELAEARAVAQELAVSNAPAIERRLPLYLMGEYRLDGAGEKKVTLTLRLLRGATEVDLRQKDGALEEMPKRLRQVAGEMFSKSLGQTIKPPDAETEAKNLVERSKVFARLTNWEEALALTEAALLLKPDQSELHNDALSYLNAILSVQRSKESGETFGNLQPNGPTAKLARVLLPATAYHVEMSVRTDADAGTSRERPFPGGGACANVTHWMQLASSWEDYQRRKADFEPIMAMARQVLAAKVAAKVQDGSLWLLWPYAEMPCPVSDSQRDYKDLNGWQERFHRERLSAIRDTRLKLLKDFGYIKGKRDWESLLGGALAPANDPTYCDFLRKAQELPHLREAAAHRLKEYRNSEVERYLASRAERARPRSTPEPPDSVPTVAKETKPPEVVFQRLRFLVDVPFGTPIGSEILAWMPVAPGVDLIAMPPRWSVQRLKDGDGQESPVIQGKSVFQGNELYLIKKKGELRLLPLKRNNMPSSSPECRVMNVCSDGQYIWVASPDPERFLAVIDIQTEQIWKFTADDGLPPMGDTSGAAVAPLAPGKICVAGYFGRTWCGTAAFDPQKGKSLKVFFEARQVWNQRDQKEQGGFDPTKHAAAIKSFRVVTGPSYDGKPLEQRLIMDNLLFDPHKGVLLKTIRGPTHVNLLHDGALYWSTCGGYGDIYRMTFPDFAPELIQRKTPWENLGGCVVYEGRVYVWGNHQRRLSVAPSFKEKFSPLRGESPQHIPDTNFSNGLGISQHYGLVLLREGATYRIVLSKSVVTNGSEEKPIEGISDYLAREDDPLGPAKKHYCLGDEYARLDGFETALPHAEAAAEAFGSSSSLENAARIAEAARAWDKAEKFFRRLSTGYVPYVLSWFQFCHRTGHGDLEAARRLAAAKVKELVDEGHPFANVFASCFYVHDGQQQKAIDALEAHFQFSNDPWYGLTLALLYDQRKDREKCLATLNRVKAVGHKYIHTPDGKPLVEFMDLAVLLADDIAKGGKGDLDLMAIEKLRASDNIAGKVSIDYFVGKYFDLHGHPERAVAYWKRCLPYVWTAYDARTSAARELRQRGVRIDDYQPTAPLAASNKVEQPPTK